MARLHHVLVLGGTGFVGRYLIPQLSAAGHRVTAVARRRHEARHLILLPTVQVVEGDPFDPRALDARMRDVTAVVNLVDILNERAQQTFVGVHVDGARKIVEACRRAGVARLLHMSAINADPAGPSQYLRSKGEAEAIVAAAGVPWTIFRPSVIFGREDKFLNLFAGLQRYFPVLPLASPHAKFAPVYVGDVARCFTHALADDRTVGQRYDLCGPGVFTLEELVRFVGEQTGRRRSIVRLGPALSKLQARMLELVPGTPMSRDNLASMQRDSICDGPFPSVFGFAPAALEATAPEWLAQQGARSRYDPLRAQRRN
ncbi:MAG TPA: complex I NDUFA9 subunit family protein [Casimicrobiaceae bacterium]|nr:complex I NDUFA9 subunit family protein [Casimicrobiaceae bacterium]